jgi:putative endonuclease
MNSCWYLYIIQCADQTLYTGITVDLDRRLDEHNAGRGARYTRSRMPVSLVFSHPFPDRASASRAEYLIKQWPRARKLQLILGHLLLED